MLLLVLLRRLNMFFFSLFFSFFSFFFFLSLSSFLFSFFRVLSMPHQRECHCFCQVNWDHGCMRRWNQVTPFLCSEIHKNFSAYRARFHMPSAQSQGVGNMWYSFDYGPPTFLWSLFFFFLSLSLSLSLSLLISHTYAHNLSVCLSVFSLTLLPFHLFISAFVNPTRAFVCMYACMHVVGCYPL